MISIAVLKHALEICVSNLYRNHFKIIELHFRMQKLCFGTAGACMWNVRMVVITQLTQTINDSRHVTVLLIY